MMKNILQKMSRRERLYVIIGLAVLLFGVVVYPVLRKAGTYRAEQQEMLANEMALLEDLYGLFPEEPAILAEHEALRAALSKADDLLFPPIENRILTQTAMIKLFNELGPDLELETTAGRSTVGDSANQMNLSIKGEGRYPEILKFMHRLETYRPLILVENFSLSERRSQRGGGGGGNRGGSSSSSESKSEPTLSLNMSVQIICQDGGQK